MKNRDKIYVKNCKKENKHFILFSDLLESMTISEYNERHETNHVNWDDIDDDFLFSCDEVLEHFGNEDMKLV